MIPFAHFLLSTILQFGCKQNSYSFLCHVMRRVNCRRSHRTRRRRAVEWWPQCRRDTTKILRGLWVFYGDIWGPTPIPISSPTAFSNSTRRISEKSSPDLSASIISIIPNNPNNLQLLLHPHPHLQSPARPQVQPLWISLQPS